MAELRLFLKVNEAERIAKNKREVGEMTKENMKKILAVTLAGMSLLGASGCGNVLGNIFKKDDTSKIKNVILMIGDGMGPNQVRAGEIYNEGKLAMQKFPQSVKVETCSASDIVTDSAAAATALATGVRTDNGRVGVNSDLEDLETIVDIAAKKGKRTGVITTEELYGATPMGFSSHSAARGASSALIKGAVSATVPSNVNLYLSYSHSSEYLMEDSDYQRIAEPADISEATGDKIFGTYKILAEVESMSLHPDFTSLDGLVLEALEYLSKDEDGFFLMTEGAHIDHGGHNNDFNYMLSELMAFDMAVEAVVEWAKDRDDTVVIVTDHETGGLGLSEDVTKENIFDSGKHFWTTTGHTSTDVWCFIDGIDVDFSKYTFKSKDRIANTDVFKIMKWLVTGKK